MESGRYLALRDSAFVSGSDTAFAVRGNWAGHWLAELRQDRHQRNDNFCACSR